jgi:hypothetical protein
MHRFDYETPIEESLSAFDDLIRAGKVHYIGFSEWNAAQIKAALAVQDARGYNRFVSSQPQYSALWRVIEAEVVPLSQKEGIGQIVWSPMAQGILTGKYLPGKKAPVLITDEMMQAMKNGSVIVDIAAVTGGNTSQTKNDETVQYHGVSIIGNSMLPAAMASDASKLYGKNMLNFLQLIIDKEGELQLNFEDDLVKGTCIAHEGNITNERIV